MIGVRVVSLTGIWISTDDLPVISGRVPPGVATRLTGDEDSDTCCDHPYATLIRDISPGDPARVRRPGASPATRSRSGAQLVRDGHDELAARLRWRRVDGAADRKERRWSVAPMRRRALGRCCRLVHGPARPGRYEFEVQAWVDRLATWRRDLRLRAEAGEDLEVEFEVGAQLLERLVDQVPRRDRERVARRDRAAPQHRPCTDRVRLTAALDDAVAAVTAAVPDPEDLTTSARLPLRVDRELAVRGAWYEFFPRSEGGLAPGAGSWDRLEAAAAAGFDVVYLPPIHPIGTSHRKGRDNTLVAGPDDVGSPWAIGVARGRPHRGAPRPGHARRRAPLRRRGRRARCRGRARHRLPVQPRPPLGDRAPRVVLAPPRRLDPLRREPAEEVPGHLPAGLLAGRRRRPAWRCGRPAATCSRSGSTRACRCSASTTPTPSRSRSGSGASRTCSTHRPDLVFLSEAFTDPPMMHSLAEIGFSQSYTYFTWRRTKWELTDLRRGARPRAQRRMVPAEPLADHARHPRRAAARRLPCTPSPPVPCWPRRMAPSWGVYSGYELCESDPVPDKEEYRDSEKYELEVARPRRPELAVAVARASSTGSVGRTRSMWRMSSLRFHHVDNDDVIAYTPPHRARRRARHGRGDRQPGPRRGARGHGAPGPGCAGAGATGVSFPVRDELTGETWDWGPNGNYVRLDPAERVGHVLSVG